MPDLCSSCQGDTVHRIPGGIATCERCDGTGWEPSIDRAKLEAMAREFGEIADRFREDAASFSNDGMLDLVDILSSKAASYGDCAARLRKLLEGNDD